MKYSLHEASLSIGQTSYASRPSIPILVSCSHQPLRNPSAKFDFCGSLGVESDRVIPSWTVARRSLIEIHRTHYAGSVCTI